MTYYNILRKNGFILMPGSSTYTKRVYIKKNTRFIIKATVNKTRHLCSVDIKCNSKTIKQLNETVNETAKVVNETTKVVNELSSKCLLNEQVYLTRAMNLMAKQLAIYDFVTDVHVSMT